MNLPQFLRAALEPATQVKQAVIPASVSAGSASVSFFVSTLPYVQWAAGVLAALSALVAIAWVVYQWRLKRLGR